MSFSTCYLVVSSCPVLINGIFVLYGNIDYGIKNNDSGETLCKGVG